MGVAMLLLAACSSDSTKGALPGPGGTGSGGAVEGDVTKDETWGNGTKLPAIVTIEAGVIVTIAPGAKLSCVKDGTIVVLGILTTASSSSHASISCDAWQGISVGDGGKIKLDGLDVSNASNGLAMGPNSSGNFDNGTINNSQTPFLMGTRSKLSVSHTKVTNTTGQSQIKGALTASYLAYDKAGNEGIILGDPTGSLDISDSLLTGSGGGDFVVAEAGGNVSVSYTKITGAHCGLHFDKVDTFKLDHVTSDDVYGAMLYGSGNGPNTISYSNITGISDSIDLQGTNGAIVIDHSYIGSNASYKGTSPMITAAASATVAGAEPR